MTTKLYYNSNNHSLRQMRAYLEDNKIEYAIHPLKTEPLSWEQLLEILMHTENGIEDLISLRSSDYTNLIAQGIDFDELTLTKFHELVVMYPKLIRSPILVAKNTTLVGYSEEEMSFLKCRKERKSDYNQILSMMQLNDINIFENEVCVF